MDSYKQFPDNCEEAISSLQTGSCRKEFLPTLQRIMREHGGKIEAFAYHCIVMFPPGTTRAEMLPRTQDVRYRIRFPDGYEICQTVLRISGESILGFPPGEFSSDLLIHSSYSETSIRTGEEKE